MNLKDIDPVVFEKQIDDEVKKRLASFESELRFRADETKHAANDIISAAKTGALDLMGQIVDPEALVFTMTVPRPEGWFSDGERQVRIDFGTGHLYDLGRLEDHAKIFGARLVLTIIPQGKKS